MGVTLLIARLLLALVFAVAGLAKLADRDGSRQAMIDFGLPAALATPLALLLPLVEVAVALALVPAWSAWWAAVGALTLLLLFVLGISVNLVRGRKPECHCFGQLHSAPAGWKTLTRNGALALVAGFLVWQGSGGSSTGPSSVLNWLGGLAATPQADLALGLVALALVVGQWWVLVNVLRQNRRLLLRVEGLPGPVSRRWVVLHRTTK
jgi:uncharacterized membrane protein YphA (DoxX/SURF4 family)